MRRNKKTEKVKFLRRLDTLNSELSTLRREMEWVPVEDPQFLGWDVSIGLSPQRQRSADAGDLLKVLDAVKMRTTTFVKSRWVIKMMRDHGRKYYSFYSYYRRELQRRYAKKWGMMSLWPSNYYYQRNDNIPSVADAEITETHYETLDANIKRYFYKSKIDRYFSSYWARRQEGEYVYKIDIQRFPAYELELKITKAYSTHRGIPNGEAQSEYDKTHDKLSQENYWCAKNGFRGDKSKWYRNHMARRSRHAWQKVLIKQNVLAPDEYRENLEAIVLARKDYW